MAKTELNAEMLRQTHSKAKGPPATTLEDRRHLIKARLIDASEVLALKEAKEARDAEKQPKAHS